MTYEQLWNELKGRIPKDREILMWTLAEGYLGERFHVVAVRDGQVHVAAAGDSKAQRIPDADFVAVLGLWNDYADGKLNPAAIEKKSKFSRHVVSILHALETPPK